MSFKIVFSSFFPSKAVFDLLFISDETITVTDVMVLVNNILNGKSTFKVVTNIDDFPIHFGGGGKNSARVSKNRPTQ